MLFFQSDVLFIAHPPFLPYPKIPPGKTHYAPGLTITSSRGELKSSTLLLLGALSLSSAWTHPLSAPDQGQRNEKFLGEMTVPLLFAGGAPGEDFKVLCQLPEKDRQVPCTESGNREEKTGQALRELRHAPCY